MKIRCLVDRPEGSLTVLDNSVYHFAPRDASGNVTKDLSGMMPHICDVDVPEHAAWMLKDVHYEAAEDVTPEVDAILNPPPPSPKDGLTIDLNDDTGTGDGSTGTGDDPTQADIERQAVLDQMHGISNINDVDEVRTYILNHFGVDASMLNLPEAQAKLYDLQVSSETA